jgi:hypothetical protein
VTRLQEPGADPWEAPAELADGWHFYQRPVASPDARRRQWDTPPLLRWGVLGAWRIDVTSLIGGVEGHRRTLSAHGRGIAAPYWLAAAVLLAVPLVRVVAAIRRGRRIRRLRASSPTVHVPPPEGSGGLLRLISRLVVAASLLLLLGVAAEWHRSYSIRDVLDCWGRYEGPPGKRGARPVRFTVQQFRGYRGAVEFATYDSADGPGPWQLDASGYDLTRLAAETGFTGPWNVSRDGQTTLHWLGFVMAHRDVVATGQPPRRDRAVTVPYCALAALALVAPTPVLVAGIRRWRKRRRAISGLCAECGYDLRASQERCPECGAEVPGSKSTAAAAP